MCVCFYSWNRRRKRKGKETVRRRRTRGSPSKPEPMSHLKLLLCPMVSILPLSCFLWNHYSPSPEDEKGQGKRRQQPHLRSSLIHDLRNELLDTPEEVHVSPHPTSDESPAIVHGWYYSTSLHSGCWFWGEEAERGPGRKGERTVHTYTYLCDVTSCSPNQLEQ